MSLEAVVWVILVLGATIKMCVLLSKGRVAVSVWMQFWYVFGGGPILSRCGFENLSGVVFHEGVTMLFRG